MPERPQGAKVGSHYHSRSWPAPPRISKKGICLRIGFEGNSLLQGLNILQELLAAALEQQVRAAAGGWGSTGGRSRKGAATASARTNQHARELRSSLSRLQACPCSFSVAKLLPASTSRLPGA